MTNLVHVERTCLQDEQQQVPKEGQWPCMDKFMYEGIEEDHPRTGGFAQL